MSHLESAWTLLGRARPYLPMATHLVLSALFPIYTGSHASLTRPTTAEAPSKEGRRHRRRQGSGKDDGEDGELSDSDEESEQEEHDSLMGRMEGLSPADALMFPVMAGCMLGLLYLLIKWAGPEVLNKILGWYFSSMACFSVGRLTSDGLAVVGGVLWPNFYVDGGKLWKVVQKRKKAVVIGSKDRTSGTTGTTKTRTSPLPGALGRISLPSSTEELLWQARTLLARQYIVSFYLWKVTSFKARLTLRTIISFVFAVGTVLYANLVDTPWYLTNLQGFAFSYTALQLLSPTTFTTGSLLLVALFFYDIYFVFYTPLMVTVATNLDVPIKLLIPRPEEEAGKKPGLAMLGLGDIVLPGIMIGMSLRFDHHLHYLDQQDVAETSEGNKEVVKKAAYVSVTGKTGDRLWTMGWDESKPLTSPFTSQASSNTGESSDEQEDTTIKNFVPSFVKTYFKASIIGYVIGMTITLSFMGIFGHAQPALLYLVPCVLSSIWLTAWAKGDLKWMWAYTELTAEDEGETKPMPGSNVNPDKSAPKEDDSWLTRIFGESFFGTAKNERNSKRLETAIAKTFQDDAKDSQIKATSEVPKGLIAFSIYPAPLRKKRREERSTAHGPATAEKFEQQVTRQESSGEEEDAVLVHKADAASLIDISSSGRVRRRKH